MRVIVLLLAAVSIAVAQKPALRRDRQVLVDFRVDRNSPTPKISPATQRAVFSKVFRRYLTDESKCNSQFDTSGSDDPLAAARKAGQIVPSISDMATGSFTAPGQTQTAYVISVSECNASHADNFGTKRVAIFSGPQLVADIDVHFNSDIELKTDLNSDGIDELLMTIADQHQGEFIELATLVSFQSGRFNVIHDFETVVSDDCASMRAGSTAKASVIYLSDVVPGKMPKITMENYVSGCRATKRWRLLSTGKMQ